MPRDEVVVFVLGVCAKALSVFLEVPSVQWITLASTKFGESALGSYWRIQVNFGDLNSYSAI